MRKVFGVNKQTAIAFLLVIFALSCLALTACHEHEFGEWTVVEQSTCSQMGTAQRTCKCGETETQWLPLAEHSFSDWTVVEQPTCSQQGVQQRTCQCGETETAPVDTIDHNFQSKRVSPTCTEQGYTQNVCQVCGYTTQTDFVDAEGHMLSFVGGKQATCKDPGWEDYEYCLYCSYTTFVEIPVLQHDYQVSRHEPTCTEQGYTEYYCHLCGDFYREDVVDALGHTYQYFSGQPATCTEIGWEDYSVCTTCNFSTYIEIPALGHNSKKEVVAPTCSENGYTLNVCTVCEKRYTTNIVPALGHDLMSIPGQPATCTQGGWNDHVVCQRQGCKYTTYKEIQPLGHNYATSWVDPTCTQDGYSTHTCRTCGDTYVDNIKQALGHTEVVDKGVLASCLTDGITEGKHCSVCNLVLVEQQVVEALGHDLVHFDAHNPSCTGGGWEAYDRCDRCGYTTFKSVPATGHTPGEWVTDVEPTCLKEGRKNQVCANCNEVLATQSIPAVGHIFQSEVVPATCIRDGYTNYTCTGCNAFHRGDFVSAIGYHDFQNSTECKHCFWSIQSVAIAMYDLSATAQDNVVAYIVPRQGTTHDLYIVGTGATKDLAKNTTIFNTGANVNAYVCSGVTSIGAYTFPACGGMQTVYIANTVTSIGNNAFFHINSLKSVVFQAGSRLQTIGYSAFAECRVLENITIPSSVESMLGAVFSGCTGLKTVVFQRDSKLQALGYSTFSGCTSLQSVTFGEGCVLSSIESSTFEKCSQLTDFEIPSTVSNIGYRAFYSSGLQSIVIPSGVTSIEFSAFYDCANLENITLNCAPQLGEKVFENTAFYNNQSNWQNGVLYIGNCLIKADSTATKFVVEQGTVSIAGQAFCDFTNLVEVEIPNSVTIIGTQAFSHCTALSKVVFQQDSALHTLGKWAFEYCSSLTSVEIPNSVTTIDSTTFAFCTLQQVSMPASICSFIDDTYLREVTITSGDLDFNFSGEALEKVTIASGVTSLGKSCFSNCDSLKTVVFLADSQCVTIGENCFANCDALRSVVFEGESTLQSIEKTAFMHCKSLTSFDMPNSVTTIGEQAFASCSQLAMVSISAGATSIGKGAFSDCSALVSVEMPEGVTTVEDETFTRCGNLASVTLSSQTTTIGARAFNNCDTITHITIPSTVTSINNSAFAGCYLLVEVCNLSDLEIVAGTTKHGAVALYAHRVSTTPGQTFLSTVGNFLFFDDGEQVFVVRYLGVDTHVSLPIHFQGKMYAINDHMFHNNDYIQSVTIPQRVTGIGKYAFCGCDNLVSVTFGDNSKCTYIGDHAFEFSGVTSIVVPSEVTAIGEYAFDSCKSLESVTFMPESKLKTIGTYAFANSSKVQSITIPQSVYSISVQAFGGMSGLQSVTFENPNRWYVSKSQFFTNAVNLNLSDPTTNVDYVTTTYNLYYWERR